MVQETMSLNKRISTVREVNIKLSYHLQREELELQRDYAPYRLKTLKKYPGNSFPNWTAQTNKAGDTEYRGSK
jgi:hypothetical protein